MNCDDGPKTGFWIVAKEDLLVAGLLDHGNNTPMGASPFERQTAIKSYRGPSDLRGRRSPADRMSLVGGGLARRLSRIPSHDTGVLSQGVHRCG